SIWPAFSSSVIFGVGTWTNCTDFGSTPLLASQALVAVLMLPVRVGEPMRLPLRSAALVMPLPTKICTPWWAGESPSLPEIITALTPAETALMKIGATVKPMSYCRPSSDGMTVMSASVVGCTVMWFLAKKPCFSATTMGSESEVLLRAMRMVVAPAPDPEAPEVPAEEELELELQPARAMNPAAATAVALRRRKERMSAPRR